MASVNCFKDDIIILATKNYKNKSTQRIFIIKQTSTQGREEGK
jgi:hypothetical protein